MSSIFVNATHPSAKPSHVAFRFVVPNAQAKTHPINQVFLDQKSGVLYVHPHALQTTLLSTFAVHQNLSASCSSAHRSRYPRGLSSSACSRSCLSQTWVSHGSTRDPGRAPTTAWHVKRESSLQTLGQFLPTWQTGQHPSSRRSQPVAVLTKLFGRYEMEDRENTRFCSMGPAFRL